MRKKKEKKNTSVPKGVLDCKRLGKKKKKKKKILKAWQGENTCKKNY